MPGDGEAAFWVERLARVTKFDSLAATLVDDERYGPYLFLLAVLLLDVPVLSTIAYVRQGTFPVDAWWQWPGVLWWFNPVLIVLVLFFLRTLSDKSHRAVRETGRDVDDGRGVNPWLPRWLQNGALLLGIAIYGVWFSTTVGPIVGRTWPVIAGIKWLVIIPFVYYTLATDLVALYLHVLIVLPLRIRRSEVPLDFSDPRGLGGFHPIGSLMRFAAVSSFVALSLFTLVWSFVFVVPEWRFTPQSQMIASVFFGLAWSLATLLLVAGVYLVHRHMAACRQEHLDRIHREIRLMGKDGETLPYTNPRGDAEFRRYLQEYVNLDRVERTRTVPFRVSVAWELVGTALLPVVLQILSLRL